MIPINYKKYKCGLNNRLLMIINPDEDELGERLKKITIRSDELNITYSFPMKITLILEEIYIQSYSRFWIDLRKALIMIADVARNKGVKSITLNLNDCSIADVLEILYNNNIIQKFYEK